MAASRSAARRAAMTSRGWRSRAAAWSSGARPRRHGHLGGGGGGGGAAVGGEVDQRGVRLVPDRADQRDRALGGGAHHGLLVEGHEVLEAAAAARDDQHVGAWHGAEAVARKRAKSTDGGGDRLRRARALHGDGPEQDAAGEAAGD